MKRAIFVLLFTACGGETPPPVAPRTVVESAASFEAEARTILDEIVAIDTSHGNETRVAKAIGERFKTAGIPFEIVEPEPGRGSVIARLKGTGKKKPLLLVAHIDVVPIEGQPWSTQPFVPTTKDGFLYGRGVGDDKSMAAAFAATLIDLAREKTPLSRDVIVALTAGEETGGFVGVKWLVEHKKELIDAEVALNEGGYLLTTNDQSAIELVGIGVSEKAYQSFRLVAHGKGGHSSVPTPGVDPVVTLARALLKIGELKFTPHVLPDVAGFLGAAARWETGPVAAALQRTAQSAPKISAEDEHTLSNDRSYGALVHTTCVTTMLSAAPADNVLPTSAEAVVNCRILPDETRDQTRARIVEAIGDATIDVTPTNDQGIGPSSPRTGEAPDAITRVAKAMWPNAPVVPVMGTGATDSRHLRAAGIVSYGISTSPMPLADVRAGHGAHGPDERRPIKWLGPGARLAREIVITIAK
jgi:acetylornithine deacetylase/succinyl-diaminopimelate desuccinylase-like protein